MGPRVGRRALLAGAALLPLTACTNEPAPAPLPDPDDPLRSAAAERERALLDRYDALLLALPPLAPRLLPLRAEHAEHLLALAVPAATTSPSAASPSAAAPSAAAPSAAAPSAASAPPPTTGPSSSGTAAPLPSAATGPTATAEALAELVTAEQTAAGAHARDALDAATGELAGLLASLAASESSHAAVLT